MGAVLTGGASTRMGATKALVEVGGVAMGRRVADALADAGCDPIVAVGGDPVELAGLGLRVVPDGDPGTGPVGGILAALDAGRTTWGADLVVVAACDLPGVTAAMVAALVEPALEAAGGTGAGGRQVIVATTDRLQPALAVWPVEAADELSRLHRDGVRSLHGVLGRIAHRGVAVDASGMTNVNTPGELARFRDSVPWDP